MCVCCVRVYLGSFYENLIFCLFLITGVHFFISVAASASVSDSGIFTSPEIAKSFDFTNEERIYKWYIYIYIFR